MAIFDKFTKKEEPVEIPESLQIDAQPGIGYAPVSGRVIRMTDVPDKVFSTEVLGKGCALWPDGDVVYAPANGWVGTAALTPSTSRARASPTSSPTAIAWLPASPSS